jgi:hypothetical protein
MRDWIKARFEEYANRGERRDEELAEMVSRNLDALSNRRTLKTYILVLASVNAVIWLSVIFFSRDLYKGWILATNVNNKIGAFAIAIIFGQGMWLTYSLFRLKFPDIEDPDFSSELFASQSYSDHSVKRWRVWLFAVIGGIVNLFLLLLTEAYSVAG